MTAVQCTKVAKQDAKFVRDIDQVSHYKVAVFLNMASMSPTIELHAAQIQELIRRNNQVIAYICKGALKNCTANPFGRKSICQFCHMRAKAALTELNVETKTISLKNHSPEVEKDVAEVIDTAVMSSLASATKCQYKEQLTTKWLNAYRSMQQASRKLFNYFINECEENKLEFVFLFNGRFACAKPALLAAQKKGLGFGLYDVKKSLHEFVFVNELLHSIKGNSRKALKGYIKNPKLAKANADIFFTKKLKNEDTGEPIYTASQQQGLLPPQIENSQKKIIAVYTTSDDEYRFIGKEWDGFVPDDQVTEIQGLARVLDPCKFELVVRLHPNQASTPENTLQRYLDLSRQYPIISVVEPLADVDTYTLMLRSDVVVTFASTIGVEACYARKPVVIIGSTTFTKMNIGYTVDAGEKAGFLINQDIKAKPIRGAIIWGNYIAAYKDELPNYQRIKNGEYLVNGKKIGHSTFRRIIQLPAKLEIEMNRPGFSINKDFLIRAKDIIINIINKRWAVK